MNYTFSSRLKISSIVLMVLGVLCLAYGFLSVPASVEEARQRLEAEEGHGDHGGGHGSVVTAEGSDLAMLSEDEYLLAQDQLSEGGTQTHGDSHAPEAAVDQQHEETQHTEGQSHDYSAAGAHGASGHGDAHGDNAHHGGHHDPDTIMFHQMQNRPWSALYVAAFFFFMMSLGVLAFYAVNRAAQAGWAPLLFRVMEGITTYIIPGGIIIYVIFVLSVAGLNHMFVWMDAETRAADHILLKKEGFLNPVGFLIRSAVYLGLWILYQQLSRRFSLAQDKAGPGEIKNYTRNFKWSAAFLVIYLISESMMSWDWIMSLDPHWFSTLFGWYLFASMFVSGITVIALVTIYLKSRGYLELVNDSHIHDLAKFMFGISIFWTYLWFSQYMLIWYANIPEEVTYFKMRFGEYQLPFLSMLVLNFAFPVLVLMRSHYKRINWFVVTTGIVILIGHYMDVYNMVMPGTVGVHYGFGLPEIGGILFFSGLFIFTVFSTLAKESLVPQGSPFLEESKQFEY